MLSRSTFSLLILATLVASPAAALGRHVVFVDNSRTEEGSGSFDKPFRFLSQATRYSARDEVIYVAEGIEPYTESVTLKRGQVLVGSAYGLEALRAGDQMELDTPAVVAATRTGPTISGSVTLAGDNILAGLTVVTGNAAAVSASAPAGPISIRNVYVRTAKRAQAVVLSAVDVPVTMTGGGIDGSDDGNGIVIWSGL